MVKYLPSMYEVLGSIPNTGGDNGLGGQGPPQGVGSQAEMRPVRADMSSIWVYLQGASACSGRRVCAPDL